MSIVAVLVGTVWLGLFAYRHVEYSQDLWWRFTITGDASRFLSASVGVISFSVFVGVMRLLRPIPPNTSVAGHEDWDGRVRLSRQAGSRGRTSLFSGIRDFCSARTAIHSSCTAWKDAVGSPWETRSAAKRTERPGVEFSRAVRPAGGLAGILRSRQGQFVSVRRSGTDVTEDRRRGDRSLLPDFSLEGSGRKGLRYAHRLAKREGAVFSIVPAERGDRAHARPEDYLGCLAGIKEHAGERLFARQLQPAYLREFPLALVRKDGNVIAFSNLWIGAERKSSPST